MLTEQKKSILQLMIALAWADGRVDKEEMEVVEALLDAFDTSRDEAKELREWAGTPRTLDEVDVACLEESDVALALQHGVLLSYIDGELSDKEVAMLDTLITKLGLTQEEAQPLLDSAAAFAKSLLSELEP